MVGGVVLAIQRIPSDERLEVPKVTDADFTLPKADRDPVRVVELRKNTEQPKVEERVIPPPATPPVEVEDDVKPRQRGGDDVKPRRRGGDVCTRHGMRKVVTRGGRSWRCRR
jgi:hypothetical protein